jgi:hypothetical protein
MTVLRFIEYCSIATPRTQCGRRQFNVQPIEQHPQSFHCKRRVVAFDRERLQAVRQLLQQRRSLRQGGAALAIPHGL